ncbi:hypothetical protein ES703_56897 [subsurface metagenome]
MPVNSRSRVITAPTVPSGFSFTSLIKNPTSHECLFASGTLLDELSATPLPSQFFSLFIVDPRVQKGVGQVNH